MPTKSQKKPATETEGDFGKFTDFMRRLVAVPHSEIKAQLDAERTSKRASRVPADPSKER